MGLLADQCPQVCDHRSIIPSSLSRGLFSSTHTRRVPAVGTPKASFELWEPQCFGKGRILGQEPTGTELQRFFRQEIQTRTWGCKLPADMEPRPWKACGCQGWVGAAMLLLGLLSCVCPDAQSRGLSSYGPYFRGLLIVVGVQEL